MTIRKNAATKAFGVEEGHAPYRLRQARYYELGMDVARWASQQWQTTGRELDLLDIGTYDGVTRKYVEAHPGGEHINYHAVDRYPHGDSFVYKSPDWIFHNIDLETGLPGLRSEAYDVIVCEQVLEHLFNVETVLREMYRVLRPGGRMIIGVPIFPDGLHLIRKYGAPAFDRIFNVRKIRGHVQSWSHRTFLNTVQSAVPHLQIEETRGFRVTSGGILRPLEYTRWWWRLNRAVGRAVPSLCIEVQIVASKPEAVAAT